MSEDSSGKWPEVLVKVRSLEHLQKILAENYQFIRVVDPNRREHIRREPPPHDTPYSKRSHTPPIIG
jgi:hypothetical protein